MTEVKYCACAYCEGEDSETANGCDFCYGCQHAADFPLRRIAVALERVADRLDAEYNADHDDGGGT